ncbi:hypothetical protein [Ruegeria lacuscaerulensis]|uniref:hypothetical protein n=1 Tax=Ruegeria lacuscaerulensis TaxID=55218 RepID=UPI00147A86A6|nr:hypothetical protein [Ruegeria lacuscaerulensis]
MKTSRLNISDPTGSHQVKLAGKISNLPNGVKLRRYPHFRKSSLIETFQLG